MNEQEKIEKALLKRATGFDTEEVSEEFIIDEGKEEILTKKKIIKKQYPPDVSAIKVLLNYYGEKTFDELNTMSDEDLISLRDKLLNELKENSTQE